MKNQLTFPGRNLDLLAFYVEGESGVQQQLCIECTCAQRQHAANLRQRLVTAGPRPMFLQNMYSSPPIEENTG